MSSTPPTYNDLIRMVRARAGGNTGSTNNGPWTDEEIADYLTQAVAELHDLLIAVYGEDHLAREFRFALAAGERWFTFSTITRPWRILRVDWSTGWPTLYGSTRQYLETEFAALMGDDSMGGVNAFDELEQDSPFYPMPRYQVTVEPIEKQVRDWRSYSPKYDFRGDKIVFNPRPDREVSVRLLYVPPPPQIAPGGASLALEFAHHDRFLVVTAAISARDKEETDAGLLMAERDRIVAHIRANAAPRDTGNAPTIVDVTGSGYLDGATVDPLARSMRLP